MYLVTKTKKRPSKYEYKIKIRRHNTAFGKTSEYHDKINKRIEMPFLFTHAIVFYSHDIVDVKKAGEDAM